MARVEQMQLGLGQVAQIGARTVGGEDLVVLAPDDQRRRLLFAEELVEARIEVDVGSVVIEQIELNLHVAGSIQQRLIVQPRARIDARDVLDAVGVLRARGLERGRAPQRLAVAAVSRSPSRP